MTTAVATRRLTKPKPITYTQTRSAWQSAVESLWVNQRTGELLKGSRYVKTSRHVVELLEHLKGKDESIDAFKIRVNSAMNAFQARLAKVRKKEVALFGYYWPFGESPRWYIAKTAEEAIDILNTYERRFNRAGAKLGMLQEVAERLFGGKS